MSTPVSSSEADPGEVRIAHFQREVLTRFLYTATLLAVPVLPAYWMVGIRPLFYVSCVFFVGVAALCFVHNLRRYAHPASASLFLGLCMGVTLAGIWFGNEQLDNKPWQMLIPMIAFLLAGSRRGVWWSLADLLALCAVFYVKRAQYEPLSVMILLTAHPIFAYAMYLFARGYEASVRAISRLSHTDTLTKTYNRQLFEELFGNLFNRARRRQEGLAVYMIDIDHFKRYNDNYGHIAGDRALSQVAEVIRRAARRATDLVFRYGGEEFCVVSSGPSGNDALFVAEAIVEGVRDLNLPHVAGERGQLTVSIGLTWVRGLDTHDTESLLRRADRALYAAKTRGRDRIEVDSEEGATARTPAAAAL
ncbi:MAG: GGDEF domain-containing protein [Gammaproteobacteria bacterium]